MTKENWEDILSNYNQMVEKIKECPYENDIVKIEYDKPYPGINLSGEDKADIFKVTRKSDNKKYAVCTWLLQTLVVEKISNQYPLPVQWLERMYLIELLPDGAIFHKVVKKERKYYLKELSNEGNESKAKSINDFLLKNGDRSAIQGAGLLGRMQAFEQNMPDLYLKLFITGI